MPRRLNVEARFPWSTRRRKHREVMVRVRVFGRGRWRWWCLILLWPKNTGGFDGKMQSVTLEGKTWLTDRSLRGNLRRKTFARVQAKAGTGGEKRSARYCDVLGPKGQRCTWERGHCPMEVRFASFRFEEAASIGAVYEHSWAVRRLSPLDRVVQEPRRRKPQVFDPEELARGHV